MKVEVKRKVKVFMVMETTENKMFALNHGLFALYPMQGKGLALCKEPLSQG